MTGNFDATAGLLMTLGAALTIVALVIGTVIHERRADRSGLPGALRRDDEWPVLDEWEDAS